MKSHLLKKLLFLILVIEIGLFGFLFFQEIKKTTTHPPPLNPNPPALKKERTQFEPEYLTWEETTADAPWSKRDAQTMVVFHDKIWVMGGIEDGETKLPYEFHIHKSDVWVSENGLNWERTLENAPWAGREDHSCGVLKEKIWVMGGMLTGGGRQNDVWYSVEI